jgi:FkbM family methyltransferase
MGNRLTSFFRPLRPFVDRVLLGAGFKIISVHEWPDGFSRALYDGLGIDVRTVFDVGANVGQSIERFVSEFPAADIYAFEPGNKAFEELRRRYSRYKNVHLNQVALSNKPGEVPFLETADTVFSHLSRKDEGFKGKKDTRLVQCDTLDNWCAANRTSRIDLLKIDTEGHDLEVLAGCKHLLASQRVKVVITEFGGTTGLNSLQSCVNELGNVGFNALFTFDTLFVNGKVHHGNVVFVCPELQECSRITTRELETRPWIT